jgi:CPA2 family monovalent cation:H+ antiporter-2
MSPFLRAIMIKKNKTIRKELKKKDHVINKAPLVGIIVIRTFICGALVIFVLSNIFHIGWILLGIVAIGIIFFLWFSKPIKKQSIAMEQRFLNNLNEKEVWRDKQRSIKKNVVESLLDLNVHLAELEIDPESENVGKQLKHTQKRQTYGVNIVSIKRGEKLINIPNGDEYIFPFDKITVVGSDEQIERLNKTLASKPPKEETTKESVTLKQFTLTENSSIIGKTIRNTTLREKYNCMIVGIERENESLVNPDINENFKEKDILWVVGEPKNLITLAQDLR